MIDRRTLLAGLAAGAAVHATESIRGMGSRSDGWRVRGFPPLRQKKGARTGHGVRRVAGQQRNMQSP